MLQADDSARIISTPLIEPYCGHTQTYVSVGKFDTPN